MAEEEMSYVCQNLKSRKNKKMNKFEQTLSTLFEMFPRFDIDMIESCFRANKGSLEKTINSLMEMNAEPINLDQAQNKNIDENIDYYIQEIEKLEKQDQNLMVQKNDQNGLIEVVSQIWTNNTDVMKDYEFFAQQYNEDDDNVFDVIGVDSNHISEEFVKNVQQYLLYLIQTEIQTVSNDLQEFPYPSQINFETNNSQQEENFVDNVQLKVIAKNELPKFNLLQKLCEDFPNMQFSQINYAFEQLGDFDNCKQFLAKYYPNDYIPCQRQYKIKDQQIIKQQQLQNYKINERFKKLSANQLRQLYQKNRDSLRALRSDNYVINRFAGKYGKQAKAGTLEHFYESQLNKIKIYEREGIDIFVALVVVEQSFTRIDLHGFYGAEIEELLDKLIEQITIYKTNSNKKKIQVEFIVGKGLHSKNRQPVIAPIAIQYFRSQNYPIISQQDGKMNINI